MTSLVIFILQATWISALAAALVLLAIDIFTATNQDRNFDSAKHRMICAAALTFVAVVAKAS